MVHAPVTNLWYLLMISGTTISYMRAAIFDTKKFDTESQIWHLLHGSLAAISDGNKDRQWW